MAARGATAAVALQETTTIRTTKIRKTQLLTDLKQYRIQQSAPLGKPAYSIFTNAVLDDIYVKLPTTRDELSAIKGIGPKKLDMFGDDILAIVAQYTDANGNPRRSSINGLESSSTTNAASVEAAPPPSLLIEARSLTAEQRHAAHLILSTDRPNVFLSGRAGTGKSYVLNFVVQELQRGRRVKPVADTSDGSSPKTTTVGGPAIKVGVCAPTGVAAIHVGGSTLHSFFGIGLGTGSLTKLVQKVKANVEVQKRINETEVLIIDECSMLSLHLLETINDVVRLVRHGGELAHLPFGGIQVICVGDFFQLPPVSREEYPGGGNSNNRKYKPFCFDSPVWQELGLSDNMVELQEVQRQDNRGDFVELLNKVRIGQMDHVDIAKLNAKCVIDDDKHPLPTDGILPTRLYSHNKDVDAENETQLAKLAGKEVVCQARNKWREALPLGTLASVKTKMADSLSKELPDAIKLKVGAQVMLTRNKDLDRSLVNGSRGVVIGFERNGSGESAVVPVVRFDCGVVTKIAPVEAVRYNPDAGGAGCLVRTQVPLKLAWAITVHKSQGATLTRAMLDISSAFEFGQCYVALSRVRSLEGLWLVKPARLENIKVSPQVLDFYSILPVPNTR
jgi:ATP-dependent DNA helicase PIF1